MRATRPTYSQEFKDDAIKLLKTTNRSFREVSEDLGVSVFSLRQWYRTSDVPKKPKKGAVRTAGLSPQEESAEAKLARIERENQALRKENDKLRMDREILKKAAAFFAKENE